MKKKLYILLIAAAAASFAGCGSSAGQTASDTEPAETADAGNITEGTEELSEETTEDAEPDNWMDYAPAYEETDEEKEYEEVADGMEQEVFETATGLIIHVKNPSEPGDVQDDIGVEFYDASGNAIWYAVAEFNSLPVGEDMYVPIEMEEDTYDTYDVSMETSKAYMEDISDSISAENDVNGGIITVSLTNGGEKEAAIASVTTLYYKNGQLQGATIDYDFELLPGNTDTVVLTEPVDYQTGAAVEYDEYVCCVYAYAESEDMVSEMEEQESAEETAPPSDGQNLLN